MKEKGFVNRYWPYLFIIVPLLLQIIFFFIPLVQGVIFSFTDWTGLTSSYHFIGIDNYISILSDTRFRDSIGFTLLFTIGLVAGQIVLGIAIAKLLNRKIKGVGLFRTAYFFPAVISTVTLGLIFKQFFNYGLVPLGEYLQIEWLSQSLIANEGTAFWGLLFVALWQGVAIPVVIFLANLQSIPNEIREAASIDGANAWQTFKKIELPFLSPAISIVLILAMKAGLTAFDLIYALTGGGPSGSTTSLGLLVYNYAFKNNQFGYASAIAIVLFIIIAIVSVIQINSSKRFEV
ncbi:sugar ABC transporter permease [Exiguobacterium indicum]|uniref:Sugar ABC transporter permease n=1 Tax=Exiguobacterium acetylicum TaxID=41170 RepID=A0ABX8GEH1_EXIAC|nr:MULTISPECIES: sugar ABC transporter permease [Exiguobacterium]AOT00477.1 sugar ABC transporter permease [Exiguobacterium sp. U13-1]KTR58672.1 sugar ABC transporter permease [Exiguobacterium indicum]QWB31440.1 sugar ABC transporter permease [Exiguobacterium acetylicum]QZY88152.1 sugar ABC transporter permease [Exiguobacterium acetylicum]